MGTSRFLLTMCVKKKKQKKKSNEATFAKTCNSICVTHIEPFFGKGRKTQKNLSACEHFYMFSFMRDKRKKRPSRVVKTNDNVNNSVNDKKQRLTTSNPF